MENQNTAVATQSSNITIKAYFEKDNVKARFEELLGKRAPQFLASVMQVVNSNDLLLKASHQSIYMASVIAATLDLPINNNLGFAYIVPYKGQAQFQLGYKGFKQLAQRSGQFLVLNETDVKEGELKLRNRMTGEMTFEWIQDEKERAKTPTVGYLSYFKLLNGFEQTFYMSVEDIEAHAKRYSQSYTKGYGVWKENKHEMSLKTVCKLNLSKNAPLSVEMRTAVQADQAVITKDGEYQYIDNEPEFIDPVVDRQVKLLQTATTLDELDLVCQANPELDKNLVDNRKAEIYERK